jgi:hypothetical protein
MDFNMPENLNQNTAPAAGGTPDTPCPERQAKPYSPKKAFLLFFIYIIALVGFLIYKISADQKWMDDFKARRAAFEKAYAEQEALRAREAAQNGGASVGRGNPFNIAPVQMQRQERVSSAELFERAARRQAGPQQVTRPQEQLDYGAQVEAYRAQLKAQEEAAKAKALEEARQQALYGQQQQSQQAPAAPQPVKLETSRAVSTGGSTPGVFGGRQAAFTPKQTAAPAKQTQGAKAAPASPKKKLETNRIYNK